MLLVESFGPSGSGKSYFKNKLIKKFSFKVFDYKSLYNLIGDRSFFFKLFYNFIKSSYLQKIKNTYLIRLIKKKKFRLIKFEYGKSIKKGSLLYKKYKSIKNLIQKSEFSNKKKKTIKNWASEEIYANHYAKKIDYQKLLLDSEGLIQRLFIYCYKKKNKEQVIKEYLDMIELPQLIIIFEKKIINKKNAFIIEKNEEEKIFKLTLSELKKRKILIVNSKIGVNKSYLKIKKKLK